MDFQKSTLTYRAVTIPHLMNEHQPASLNLKHPEHETIPHQNMHETNIFQNTGQH